MLVQGFCWPPIYAVQLSFSLWVHFDSLAFVFKYMYLSFAFNFLLSVEVFPMECVHILYLFLVNFMFLVYHLDFFWLGSKFGFPIIIVSGGETPDNLEKWWFIICNSQLLQSLEWVYLFVYAGVCFLLVLIANEQILMKVVIMLNIFIAIDICLFDAFIV